MNIEDLTVREVRELLAVFGQRAPTEGHLWAGQKVLVVLPHGFIYFGVLREQAGHLLLCDASNLRYWEKRDSGLGGFVAEGPRDGDRVDRMPGDVLVNSHISMMRITKW